MKCVSKHFFKNSQYQLYLNDDCILIGQNELQIKYTLPIQLSTIIIWSIGNDGSYLGFQFKWKKKWKQMQMDSSQCYQLKQNLDGKVAYKNYAKMFNVIKFIRKCNYGSIQLGYCCVDQKPYQIKIISDCLEYIDNEIKVELEVLQFRHKNMIQLVDYFIENEKAYLIFENLEGRTLKERINSQYLMQKEEIIIILKQILNLLVFLHSQGYACRNFNKENIYILKEGRIILTEFSQSIKIGFNINTKRGTKEIDTIQNHLQSNNQSIIQEDYDRLFWQSQDIYDLGILLHEMIFGKPLQHTIFDKSSYIQSSSNSASTSIKNQNELKLLLGKMLEPDMKQRITAQLALYFLNDLEFGDESFVDFIESPEIVTSHQIYDFQCKAYLPKT